MLSRKLFLLFFFTTTAHAFFMVEPSYNYIDGTFESSSQIGKFIGRVTAVNLGYLGEENFMFGLAIEKGQYSYDSNVTTNEFVRFEGGGIGTFIGFHYLDYIKVWTTFLNSTLEPIDNPTIRYFGEHLSFGIGLRLLDGFILNYQKYNNTFLQIEEDSTAQTSRLDPQIRTEAQVISLSYMFLL